MFGVLRPRLVLGCTIWVCLGTGLVRAEDTPAEWDRPRQEITTAWRVHQEAVARGQKKIAKEELEHIWNIQNRYALDAIPSLSVALLNEVTAIGPEMKDDLDYAEKFSPELSALDTFRCQRGDWPEGTLAAFRRCIHGLYHDMTTPAGILRATSNFVLMFTHVIAALAVILSLFFLFKHGRAMLHYWCHMIRQLMPLTAIPMALMAGVLIWVAFGWVGPPLLLLFLLWRYLSLGERLVAGATLLGAALLPLLLLIPALQLRYQSSILSLLAEPMDGLTLARAGERLRNWIEEHPSDSEAIFALAQIEKHTERFGSARQTLEKTIRVRPNWYKPLVNLGSIDYLEKRTSAAIEHFQQAIASNPQSIRAYFNVAKIYYQETRLDEGRAAQNKAKEIDSNLFGQFQRLNPPQESQWFMLEEKLSLSDMEPRIWALTPDVFRTRDELHASLFPTLPVPLYWALLGGTFLLSVAWRKIRPILRPPGACEKCGQPSCATCDPSVERETLCSQCYHIFVRLESIEPEARRAKERQVARHRMKKDLSQRWSAVVVPGLHRLARDESIFGFLFIGLGLLFLMPLLFRSELIALPYTFPGFPMFPTLSALALGFGAVYLMSLYDAFIRR